MYKGDMTDIDSIKQRFADALDGTPGFGATVVFDCGDDGAITVDGAGDAIAVRDGTTAAQCTITMTTETLGAIIEGELEEAAAFTGGLMKLSGEIRLATLVSNLLRARAQEMVQAEMGDAS